MKGLVPRHFAVLSSPFLIAVTNKAFFPTTTTTRFISRIDHHNLLKIPRGNIAATMTHTATATTTSPTTTIVATDIHTPIDITLTCSDGIQLAAQIWKSTTTATKKNKKKSHCCRILCLHGWMDNCRSFHYFAPNVLQHISSFNDDTDDNSSRASNSIEIVTIDLPGHGWSTHKSSDGPPILITDYVYYVAEAIQQLHWYDNNNNNNNDDDGSTRMVDDGCNSNIRNEITLVGHSMGAAISCLYAAAFPEQITKLILLEGAGPMTRPDHDFTKHIRDNIIQRQKQQQLLLTKTTKSQLQPRIYPTLHQAIMTRIATVKKFPGQQYISEIAATELVVRGTKAVDVMVDDTTTATTSSTATNNSNNNNNNDISGGTTGTTGSSSSSASSGYQFRHDPRLQLPSIQYCTVEQLKGIYQTIACPVGLFLAQDGWPLSSHNTNNTTTGTTTTTVVQSVQEWLQPKVVVKLPGSHHFHADPDTAAAVVEHVISFLMDDDNNDNDSNKSQLDNY